MNNPKILFVIIAAVSASLLASSTVGFTNHVFAQKDNNTSGSSGSAKSDYDKFQSCLSDAASGGSATKGDIKECFNNIYSGGSSSGDSGK